MQSSKWPQLYIAISITTFATLLLELSLTRIFSVVFLYHFAFLAISIAMFGLGAGGVLSYFLAKPGGNSFSRLGMLAAANSVASIASIAFLLSRQGQVTGSTLMLVYFASAIPFCLAGAIVSMAISEAIGRVGRAYFFDLAGAAGGCLALIPLLNQFGGPNTVLFAAILYAVSAIVWFRLAGARLWQASLALPALLVLLLAANQQNPLIDVRYTKGQSVKGERFVQWNSFSRIAIVDTPVAERKNIIIDGDASTFIAPYDFNHLSDQDRKTLLSDGPGFAYNLRPGAKSLVIGPGGGTDVARALASGSRDITGVEINPIIADTIMRGKFAGLSHNLYFRPEVRIVVEDGRSFVRHSSEKYQVLQATLVDTWASTAAGAFALTENNLYTTEAFREYLSHLTDDGVLTFTRWALEPPRESLRLVSLAMEALRLLGEGSPEKHVMVVRDGLGRDASKSGEGEMDTVIISRKPFTANDLAIAQNLTGKGGVRAIYLPGTSNDTPFRQLLTTSDPAGYQAAYAYNVSPVYDDSPFFFYTVQPRDVLDFGSTDAENNRDYKINVGVPVLVKSLLLSLVATGWILALPPLFLGNRLPRERGAIRMLSYFAFLGAGYILIQVAFIQKFVLLLGHPTYALTVIIFTMLVSSGLGSFRSAKVAPDQHHLTRVLAIIGSNVIFLGFVITPLAAAAVGWNFWAKVLLTVAVVAPPSYMMGMPFPAGLTLLEKRQPAYVRWAWSLNAAASVMGSALALFFAIYFGLRATLIIGAALYLGALWASRMRTATAEDREIAAAPTLAGQAAS